MTDASHCPNIIKSMLYQDRNQACVRDLRDEIQISNKDPPLTRAIRSSLGKTCSGESKNHEQNNRKARDLGND